MAADYARVREQFGRVIATFQAVGQRAADAYVDAEAIRLTAWQAAWRIAEGLLPKTGRQTWLHNQALMELGALVCSARAPKCSVCPVRRQCRSVQPDG